MFPIVPIVVAALTATGIGAAAAWWMRRDKTGGEPVGVLEKEAIEEMEALGTAAQSEPVEDEPFTPMTSAVGGGDDDDDEDDLILELEGVTGGGGGGGGDAFLDPPPNISKDKKGYNTKLYPDSLSVRKGFRFLGYDMGLIDSPPSATWVKAFQTDYNQASSDKWGDAEGRLLVDGVPGKYTLRALEVAVFGTDGTSLDDILRGNKWASRFGA